MHGLSGALGVVDLRCRKNLSMRNNNKVLLRTC